MIAEESTFVNYRHIEAIGDMPAARTFQRRYRVVGTKMTRSFAARGEMPGLTSDLADLVHELVKGLFDPYRPELHYMRGPGPKSREKYACSAGLAR